LTVSSQKGGKSGMLTSATAGMTSSAAEGRDCEGTCEALLAAPLRHGPAAEQLRILPPAEPGG